MSVSGIEIQIPRNALALLMVAQAMVVGPHSQQLSPWIMGVCLICGLWRWMVYQGRWDFPRRWLKGSLVVASVIAVALSGTNTFSLEMATSLLILAFALKLVEMKSVRDAYLVIYLSYFIIATEFLFSQSIGMAAYELLAAVTVTAAMVGMNQMHTKVRPMASFKLASALIFQTLPLVLVLFLFFPRIAPLWSIPLPGGAKTGISDTVTPGDIAKLSRSEEIAFRVEFKSKIPPTSQLYWRGLVYSHFNEGAWTQARRLHKGAEEGVIWGGEVAKIMSQGSSQRRQPQRYSRGAPVSYEVLLEPTQSKWLFGLALPVAAHNQETQFGQNDIGLTRDFRLLSRKPVGALLRYQVDSYPEVPMDLTLPRWLKERETRLPVNDNPRMRAYARQQFAKSNGIESFAQNILLDIRKGQYRYTLSPPTLPRKNSIDNFWFDTQAGFCSHYAGAFVYMMRAAGIPARMVGGYQGGEFNPRGKYFVVRQMDAHAWAEIWVSGRGWVRYDPTSAVAPERIEHGLDAALSSEDLSILSAFTKARISNFAGLADVIYVIDSIGHNWNLWVVGYDPDVQAKYLSQLIGDISPGKVAIVLLVGASLSMGLVVIALFWRRRKNRMLPVLKIFIRFSKGVKRFGFVRESSESPAQFIARIDPSQHALVAQLDHLLYNSSKSSSIELNLLRKRLRKLQVAVALGLIKEYETA
ncbi:MAG: DUF3488 and transglutaminase-like domain-containing protein [Pseudomonadales bacterium]|nr:DUF3488 and transglutaminase-like domain-containing protein [Pseudomonadales bacterium]